MIQRWKYHAMRIMIGAICDPNGRIIAQLAASPARDLLAGRSADPEEKAKKMD
jgi:hypothetical protein